MAHPAQMNNLTTLIKRLEAATSRLEDIASIPIDPNSGAATALPSNASAASLVSTTTIQNPPPPAPEPLPASVEDFDELIVKEVAKYVEKSTEIGDLVEEQSKAVEKCFAAQRKFLVITTKAKKPGSSTQLFVDLVAEMQTELTNVSNIRENNRHSALSNHLSTVSEGIPGLAWVTVEGKPAKYVREMLGAAQFFGNRVITSHKETSPKHVEWVRSFYTVLTVLETYVANHHALGVTWNARGIDAKEALALASSPSAASQGPSPTGGAPPPPPPPPPPPLPPPGALDGPGAPAGGDIGSVFAEINRGSDVTAGLRKVNKDEMTHKNPSLRASSIVPAKSSPSLRAKSPAPPSKSKPAHLTKKKPPKRELDGSKWYIENYENEQLLTLEDVEINHSVFIFRCKNTTIQIKGKINAVSLNECVKTNIIVDNLVSSIEVIKSNNFAMQIMGKAPNLQVDQCDGGTVYVSKESLGIEIFTSKSSAININVPGAGEDWDYQECPVPEQLKTTIKGGKLETEIVEHAG